MQAAERPDCACHGQPMYRGVRGDKSRFWQCAIKKRAYAAKHYAKNVERERAKRADWYQQLPGVRVGERNLKDRRRKALVRRRERQLRRETEGAGSDREV